MITKFRVPVPVPAFILVWGKDVGGKTEHGRRDTSLQSEEPDVADSVIHARTNKQLEFNLGTFNIPTVVGLVTIIAMIWAGATDRAARDATFEARLNQIDKDRAAGRVAYDARLDALTAQASLVPNLQYRITVNEQAIASTNSRLDRQGDALDGLRDDIAGVRTSIEVLTQKIDMALPSNRTDLNILPQELDTRTR